MKPDKKASHERVHSTVQVPRKVFASRVGQSEDCVLFATHGSCGVLDLGATKTVMGSNFIPEFLQGLSPSIRKQVSRCQCKVTFRFGNQGTLTSDHALVIPVGNLNLKIAIVKGSTPFLLSNASIAGPDRLPEPSGHESQVRTYQGLFLMDANDLVAASRKIECTAQETFVTDDRPGEKGLQTNPM